MHSPTDLHYLWHIYMQINSLPAGGAVGVVESEVSLVTLYTKQLRSQTQLYQTLPGADWDKISGREISHSSRPSHTPTTNSETWATPLAYLYDHHITRSKSLVGPWKIIKGSLLNCTFTSLFLFFIFSNISVAASQFAYLYYVLKVCILFVKKKYILLSM